MNIGLGRLWIVPLLLVHAPFWPSPSDAADEDRDLLAIEQTVKQYLESGTTGDVDLLRDAFHSSVRLQFVDKDQYGEWSGKDYISWRKPGKTSDHTFRILSIDCTGNAAMAKTEVIMRDQTFIDYLSLLKIDSRWWIVNKVFYKMTGSEVEK